MFQEDGSLIWECPDPSKQQGRNRSINNKVPLLREIVSHISSVVAVCAPEQIGLSPSFHFSNMEKGNNKGVGAPNNFQCPEDLLVLSGGCARDGEKSMEHGTLAGNFSETSFSCPAQEVAHGVCARKKNANYRLLPLVHETQEMVYGADPEHAVKILAVKEEGEEKEGNTEKRKKKKEKKKKKKKERGKKEYKLKSGQHVGFISGWIVNGDLLSMPRSLSCRSACV